MTAKQTKAMAVDSHAHVFSSIYPFQENPLYVPSANQLGTVKNFGAVLDSHGFTHALLVGAAPYGPDNRCLLDAIRQSKGRYKGIALIRPDIPDRELATLNESGIVGARVNLIGNGLRQLEEPGAELMLHKMKELGWFLQIHCQNDDLALAKPLLLKAGIRIMVDHFGRPNPRLGIEQRGFQTLLEFGKWHNAVVKLSGPFRSSVLGHPYNDVDEFVHAAIQAFGLDRCVWGSDWPYMRMEERIDYGPPLVCLDRWLPDPKDQEKILCQSPARLFGFNQ
jgi:predicted TIM-barrel fold metal-dependent hydrolase